MGSASRRAALLAVGLIAGIACATGTGGPDPDGGGGGKQDGGGDPPDGGGPIDAPAATVDANPSCSPCELVSQCGCAADQACDLDGTMLATGGTACRPVTVNGMAQATCGGVTACGKGWRCFGGQCVKWCAADGDCPGAAGFCAIHVTYGQPPTNVPGAKLCTPVCDPVASTGCPSTWGCNVFLSNEQTPRNVTWCRPPGAGGNGAACTYSDDCQAGFACVTTNGTNYFCRRNCRISPNPSGCTSGSCTGFDPPATVAGTTYGACL